MVSMALKMLTLLGRLLDASVDENGREGGNGVNSSTVIWKAHVSQPQADD